MIEEEANTISNQSMPQQIDKIANTLLTHSSTSNRGYIVNNLEQKLLKAYGHLGPRGKKHVQLIMEGIKLKVLNETKDNNKQMTTEENAAKEDIDDHQEFATEICSKIESLIENELNHFYASENQENKTDLVSVALTEFQNLSNDLHTNKSRRLYKHEPEFESYHDNRTEVVDKDSVKLDQNVNHINNFKISNEWKIPPVCHNFINRTCEDIKNMNRLKCRYEQSYVTLDKLCDGNSDCAFESDEKNCYSQDSSFHETNNSDNNDQINEELKARREGMANNIALVISSLAFALDGALCSSKLDSFNTRRDNDLFDIDLDKEFKKSLSPPSGCTTTSYAKFETSEMYNNVHNMLKSKASEQRQPIHKKFILLSDSIIRLQKLTTKTVPNLITIKKVISNLKVLEKTEKPTPQTLKIVAKDILKDLVVTYENVEKYRISAADFVLGVFMDISQIILESLKSCRK
ncbi:uncharacterized protein [Maniola hyperantus]|uniref:uncharacterized protein n=1 Tax=Aphantopus hyperantus TaxID=2795564 RepID=UPI0037495530